MFNTFETIKIKIKINFLFVFRMAPGTIWTFTRSHTFCKSRTTSFTFQSEIPSSSLVRYCIVFRVFYKLLSVNLEYNIAFDLSLYIFIDIGFKNF
jgi:hypothetical protein